MLLYDPIPWLMKQNGLWAVRARRALRLECPGDAEFVAGTLRELRAAQMVDGSWEHSLMKTAGVLNLLDDLQVAKSEPVIPRAADFLLGVLEAQPSYARAKHICPGTLKTACDLFGFFGPYADRGKPSVMVQGAREMNFYREYEPLLGPKSPVRDRRRSSRDTTAGPSSCYTWGLIPLSYAVEALCRAGVSADKRLAPALNALLGAQSDCGGWCRSLGGHPGCTLPALRAVAAHPRYRRSSCAERAVAFLQSWQECREVFSTLHAITGLDLPCARDFARDMLASVAAKQRKNGTFGVPCQVPRVIAVLAADRMVRAE